MVSPSRAWQSWQLTGLLPIHTTGGLGLGLGVVWESISFSDVVEKKLDRSGIVPVSYGTRNTIDEQGGSTFGLTVDPSASRSEALVLEPAKDSLFGFGSEGEYDLFRGSDLRTTRWKRLPRRCDGCDVGEVGEQGVEAAVDGAGRVGLMQEEELTEVVRIQLAE
jgi:hypothetical protein